MVSSNLPDEPFLEAQDWWRTYCEGPGAALDAIGDYLAAETIFAATVTGGGTYVLERIEMAMAYTGAQAKFDVLRYGPIDGGLTNGIRIRVVDQAGTHEIDGGQPIKTNFDWAITATGGASLQRQEDAGQNDDGFFGVSWQLANLAKPISLRSGDAVQVVLNDDFSVSGFMTRHRFIASGYRTNRYPL